jgi:hypothetical protein
MSIAMLQVHEFFGKVGPVVIVDQRAGRRSIVGVGFQAWVVNVSRSS